MAAVTDLTGRRFGRLLVIERAENDKGGHARWRCRCDCGKEKVIIARSLVGGRSRSCGCMITGQAGREHLGHVDGTALTQIKQGRKANKNSSTGVLGVYWSKSEKCYIAKIGIRGKTVTIGRFARLEDAAKARAKAEEELFAPLRSGC